MSRPAKPRLARRRDGTTAVGFLPQCRWTRAVNPMTFLRRLASAAVLNGIHDALTEVTPDGTEPPSDLAALQSRIAANRPTIALPERADTAAPTTAPTGQSTPALSPAGQAEPGADARRPGRGEAARPGLLGCLTGTVKTKFKVQDKGHRRLSPSCSNLATDHRTTKVYAYDIIKKI